MINVRRRFMIKKINNLWSIEADTTQDADYYCAILKYLLQIMYDIYGNIKNYGEPCIIKNDSSGCNPITLYSKSATIVLHQKKASYWAQTLYQLSHELTHYYIRQYKSDMHIIVKWFEETLCEAISLVGLNFAAKNWRDCTLSRVNPGFNTNINQYLQDELNKPEKSILRESNNLSELKSIENSCTEKRDDRILERDYLYKEIIKSPKNFRVIKDYTKYINSNKITIDFDKWYTCCPSQAVIILSSIQPQCKTTI